ncbi:hypothetical protein CHELA17_64939 [Chelatococcus asaccharovorans]|nr:hypothetical protein CHELA17_64939 [Chelatococcus asaccharovorans]
MNAVNEEGPVDASLIPITTETGDIQSTRARGNS